MIRAAALLAIAVVATHPVEAQTRDAAAPATGTASIAGRVLSDTQPPRPLRRAIVTINAPDRTGSTAITDDAGRFAFANLPAGRYTLSASKRGWVAMSYGARASGRPGRSIPLADGQRATATLQLPRGAVITGVITDQNGSVPQGVSVRVMRYAYAFNSSEKRLLPANGSGVDERGVYRIHSLPPGEYYVAAFGPRDFLSQSRDLHLTSDVDVQEALRAVQAAPTTPVTDVAQRAVGVTPVFYPGTPNMEQATRITLRAGEERGGVDFTVQYVAVSHVSGTVQGPDGQPPVNARVTLVTNTPSIPDTGIEGIRNAFLDNRGQFDFSAIAPGQYVLMARMALPGPTGPNAPPPQVLSSIVDVDVQGDDVTGLTLVLQEGLTVTGTVRTDGTAPPPRLNALRVNLAAVQTGNAVNISTGGTTARDDGSFTLTGVTPGRYRLTLFAPTPWLVRSATIGGQDSLDLPVEIRESIDDAVITLTDRKSELSGRIENGAGGADYSIILFPENRAFWVGPARRILTARTAADGTYLFGNVPPGDYQLAAVDDVEPGEWYDPAFLQRLAPSAMKITIAEGEKKVQDIKIGGGG